jgi:hypothetical protein
VNDRRQLPSQVDGVGNASVHALTAGRTMDMGCVAEEEGSALAKGLCHQLCSFRSFGAFLC